MIFPCYVFLCCRLGIPDDISGAAAFLASDDARYMTGETMVIAGGMTSHL